MNTRVIVTTLFLAASLFCKFNLHDDDGEVGQTKKPLRAPLFLVKGCFCHGDSASIRTHVWIAGPETLAAGTRALYTINVAKDSSIAAGFDVAAFYGDLGVYNAVETQLMRIDPNSPIDSLELTHRVPELAGGRDTISWSFWYRAPQTFGIIDTIYSDGNSVDTSFDPDGDYWNFGPNFLVHVVNPTDVLDYQAVQSFHLMQNYPNPFNPSTTIRYALPHTSFVTLTVLNTLGQQVAQLVKDRQQGGFHEVVFRGDGLASGVCLYRIQVGDFVQTKKMLLLK